MNKINNTEMKRVPFLIIFLFLFQRNVFSQTDSISGVMLQIIQCETDNWEDKTESIIFDTSNVFVDFGSDSTEYTEVTIEEFGIGGYQIDTSAVYYLKNGKRILSCRPKPILYSEPLRINNNTVFRWKKLLFNKQDLSCYYLWDDWLNPRGVKKTKSNINTCYLVEEGHYYYFDTNNNLCSRELIKSLKYDTLQSITIGKYTIAVTYEEDLYRIVFRNGDSCLKWSIKAENVFLNKNGSNTFSLLVSTQWPAYILLSFQIKEDNKIQYSVRETVCVYDTDAKKWVYYRIINEYSNVLPWIVKEIEGDSHIMSVDK